MSQRHQIQGAVSDSPAGKVMDEPSSWPLPKNPHIRNRPFSSTLILPTLSAKWSVPPEMALQ